MANLPARQPKTMQRPPLPPFTAETARQKVRLAEDAWNGRDPARVALAYTPDSRWRNRAEFIEGRAEIEAFLTRKWNRELDYRLIKELWTFSGSRIAVRFAYEYHDDSGNWFRAYGNENWEFDDNGLMPRRIATLNDLPIAEFGLFFFGMTQTSKPLPAPSDGILCIGDFVRNPVVMSCNGGGMRAWATVRRRRLTASRDSARRASSSAMRTRSRLSAYQIAPSSTR